MDVARKDIVLSEGWGEDQFQRMAALAGGDVEFRTLPVVRYENINGQDVNIIDPAKIRAEIARAISGETATHHHGNRCGATTSTGQPADRDHRGQRQRNLRVGLAGGRGAGQPRLHRRRDPGPRVR